MYINFDYLEKKGIGFDTLMILCIVFQKDARRLESSFLVSELEPLVESGYCKLISSESNFFKAIRLTSKTRKILMDTQRPNYSEEVDTMTQELIQFYRSNNLILGNITQINKNCAWFVAHTGILPDMMKKFIKTYVQEKQSKNDKYIKSLERFVWEKPHAYAKSKSLADSMLYQYIKEKTEK